MTASSYIDSNLRVNYSLIKNVTSFFCFTLKVILANVQSMRRTLEEMERCEGELHLPQGAEESLLVFSRARLLGQPLEELEHLTEQQARLLEVEHEV